jgi:glycosyltransferase involved in cell wall biosynthesis
VRILFITERFPYPLDDGGNVRTFNILRGLAQQHDITLLATHISGVSDTHLSAVAQLGCAIRLVRVAPNALAREAVTFTRSIISRQPFVLLRHSAAAVHAELRRLLQSQVPVFDAVHFNHLDAALYNSSIPQQAFRVLDQHNVVTNQVKTTLPAETRWVHRTILRYELRKLASFEAQTCNAMDLCLVCSEADEAALLRLGVKTRIVVVPNGADLEYFVPSASSAGNSHEVIFIGALDYDPCEKGVWYFCTEILPILRQQMSDIRLVVVGRNPSARLRMLARVNSNIVLTGRVDDVRPHVHRAGVFVVPLLSGSGTRLKILEALAMGVPVVSTTIGAEGIAGTNGVHFRIADTAADFARAVLQILGNPQEAESLRVAGRLLMKERYSWQAVCRTLLSAYA